MNATKEHPGVVTLLAPVSGVIVPLDHVPDRAFAERMVGDGASIDPLGNEVLAPCDGRILLVRQPRSKLCRAAAEPRRRARR